MSEVKLCPKFEVAFDLLGKRWTGLIIQVLLSEKRRFTDISEMIPQLSDRMLVERLKELEAAGVVHRSVIADMPVRVEYELTDKGLELAPVMSEVQKWADRWYEKMNE